MAIEEWIDKIADLAETVSDGRGGYVKAYRCFDKADFPAAITVTPCAITYPLAMTPQYTAGLCLDFWEGKTEFHLFDNAEPQNIPEVMRYYARIKAAFAGHINLWATVGYCKLTRIEGLSTLAWGSELPHWGLLATWTVKEETTNDFTVA
jgi:hypothetical protein